MIRFLELLIALLIVAALFVVVGLFLPGERYVEHSLETNRPLRQVYDTLNNFRRFDDWHPLRVRDPRLEFTLEGPQSGVGARLVYTSKDARVGSGTLEIVESLQDQQVVIEATNDSYGDTKRHTFTLDERGKTIEITWGYQVDYGWNLFGRYAGLYVNRTVGDDVRVGLGNLVGLLATMPNHDYKSMDIQIVDVEPTLVLFRSMETDRNITAVENGMSAALDDVRAAIKANKLEEAGVPRLITTNFGSEKYEFDVAIPVRRPEGAEAPAAAAPADDAAMADDATVATDGTATDGAATEPPAIPLLEGLTLPENVQQGVTYAGRALYTEYEGHPAALPLVRDMLRAYAASHGDDIHDRAFEEYMSPIETAPEESLFKVYWPIRSDGMPSEATADPARGYLESDSAGPAAAEGESSDPAAADTPVEGEAPAETPTP